MPLPRSLIVVRDGAASTRKARVWPMILMGLVLCAPLRAQTSAPKPRPAAPGPVAPVGSASPTYNQLVQVGYDLLRQGQVQQAYLSATRAASIDAARFEAYALAALALHARGDDALAREFVEKATARSPAGKKAALAEIARLVGVDSRRRLDALMLITRDADAAKNADARQPLLIEFLTKSTGFLADYPSVGSVWSLRAAIALELNYSNIGWAAARQLRDLGLDKTNDPKIRRIMAELERKNWLGDAPLQRDWSKSTIDQVVTAAKGGDADAQIALGNWYYFGATNIPKDPKTAVSWFREAAQKGDVFALYNLATTYFGGVGVEKNEAEGLTRLRTAALHGYSMAQHDLAGAYANSALGLPRSDAEAQFWYRKAAAQGYVESQNSLAWDLATNADPAMRNGPEAVRWAEQMLSDPRNALDYRVDTLAAVYAEVGNWEKAIVTQEKAIALLKTRKELTKEVVDDYNSRLALFKQRQPYRRP